jgi:hypothetical protein
MSVPALPPNGRSTVVERLHDHWAETPDAGACPTCAHLRRQLNALGRLRFELQKQVNHGEARARAAEARVTELEKQLREPEATYRGSGS